MTWVECACYVSHSNDEYRDLFVSSLIVVLSGSDDWPCPRKGWFQLWACSYWTLAAHTRHLSHDKSTSTKQRTCPKQCAAISNKTSRTL